MPPPAVGAIVAIGDDSPVIAISRVVAEAARTAGRGEPLEGFPPLPEQTIRGHEGRPAVRLAAQDRLEAGPPR